QGFFAGGGFQGEIPEFRAFLSERPAHQLVIIDDQDSFLRHRFTLSSPGGTCTLRGFGIGAFDRQMNAELRALAESAAGFDFAAMGLYDAIGEGETETCAFFPGGKEWPEDLRKRLRRDALAVVFHSDERLILFARDTHVDLALAWDGLDPIQDQVEDHLLDQCGIMAHQREG